MSLCFYDLFINVMHFIFKSGPRPRLLITSGVMWRDIDLIRLVKQVLQLLYGDYSRYR